MLLEKIKNQSAHVVVVGIGYVGLPLVVELATRGLPRHGLRPRRAQGEGAAPRASRTSSDIPTRRSRAARQGGQAARVDRPARARPGRRRHRLRADAAQQDQGPGHDASSRPRPRRSSRHQHADMLVVLESTTYPGTTREVLVRKLTRRRTSSVGKDVFVAFSPERVDPGNAKFGTRNTPKVIGGMTPACLEVAEALYGRSSTRVVPVSSHRRGRDGEAPREHVPRGEHRPRERGRDHVRAARPRHLGGHRRRGDQALRLHAVLPGPGPRRSLHPDRSALPVVEDARRSSTGALHRARRQDQQRRCPSTSSSSSRDALNDAEEGGEGLEAPRLRRRLQEGHQRRARVARARRHRGPPRAAARSVSYLDPYVPSFKEHGHVVRVRSSPKASFAAYDAVVIVTDHTDDRLRAHGQRGEAHRRHAQRDARARSAPPPPPRKSSDFEADARGEGAIDARRDARRNKPVSSAATRRDSSAPTVLLVCVLWAARHSGLELLPPWSRFRDVRWWTVPAYLAIGRRLDVVPLGPLAVLLRRSRPTCRRSGSCAISLVGFAAILLLPFRLGEFVRPACLREKGKVSFSAATGSIVAERIVDGVFLSVVLVIALFVVPTVHPLPEQVVGLPVTVAQTRGYAYVTASAFIARPRRPHGLLLRARFRQARDARGVRHRVDARSPRSSRTKRRSSRTVSTSSRAVGTRSASSSRPRSTG